MPTVSDITDTVLSGYAHIDALLDVGPDWNYLTPVGNTILYTFSVDSGNEAGYSGQRAFTAMQQVYARQAMAYISELTGIQFSETTTGTAAQIHLCSIDIPAANTTGLCSWTYSISHSGGGGNLISYDNDTYVYLDNAEFASRNANLAPGGYGYETLLHELGHALGLKHPFEGDHHLDAAVDNTDNTLMSYTSRGGAHSTFSEYDIAALNFIYGRDGLRGALGMNAATDAVYLTGTSGADTLTGTGFNDTLQGNGGSDTLLGGAGTDTAVFRSERASYAFSLLSDGNVLAIGTSDGNDVLSSIETVRFSDGSYQLSQLVGAGQSSQLTGTAGNDRIFPTSASDTINGMGGLDTVVYNSARGGSTIVKAGAGFSVAGPSGTDTLANVERIQFSDSAVALDIEGVGGQAYRIYEAAYGRAPDAAGLGYWISVMDKGASLESVAGGFIGAKEFRDLYGTNPGNEAFVNRVYENVLGRTPDPAGYAFWLNDLNRGATTQSAVLALVSEGFENKAQVIGTIENGFAFQLWQG